MNRGIWGTNDPVIERTLSENPEWLPSRVFAHLVGHPDPDACWVWTKGKDTKGYGRVYTPQDQTKGQLTKSVTVHRVTWISLHGPIPARRVLDHDGPNGCSNKACANPAHLQVVTNWHNTVLSPGAGVAYINAAKTHCNRGHLLAGDNITPWAKRKGTRSCRLCEDRRQAERQELVRGAADALGMGWVEYLAAHGGGIHAARRILAEVAS